MPARNGKPIIRLAGTLFVFLLGIFIGTSAPEKTVDPLNTQLSESKTEIQENVPTETDNRPLLVVSNEKTCWVDRYTECGHEYVVGHDEDISELSRERLLKLYPEVFALDAATGEQIMLERDVEGFCIHHVLLKLSEGRICIYALDEATHELRELAGIDTDVEVLPYYLLSELAEGVLFDDMAQVDAYLEGIES